MAERQLPKLDVAGSIPVSRSTKGLSAIELEDAAKCRSFPSDQSAEALPPIFPTHCVQYRNGHPVYGMTVISSLYIAYMGTTTVEAPPGIAKSKFIPELNGVRGVAILAVLFYHFGSLYTPERRTFLDHCFESICHCGWMGVDLFFALSGFLITGILLDAKGSPRYFSSFYVRRVLRIFPLYYGVLIAVFWLAPAMSALLHRNYQAAPSQWSYWLHVSNWMTAFNPAAVLVTNFWTLSVEEQFYLVWPAVIALCPSRWNVRLCLLLVVAAVVARNVPALLHVQATHDNFMYRLTPFRIDPLVMGAIGAVLVRRQSWPAIAGMVKSVCVVVGLLLLVAVVARERTVWPGNMIVVRFGYTGVALLCIGVVLHAYEGHRLRGFRGAILRSGALTRLGEYSYGIYVFH